MLSYNVSASDGKVGKLRDLAISEKDWAIRYAVVDTGTLLPGKKVLVANDWIDSVSWGSSLITLDTTVDLVMNAPEFSSIEKVDRDYEQTLAEYYRRRGYWEEGHSA